MFKTILSFILISLLVDSAAYAHERKITGVWHQGTGSNLYTSARTLTSFMKAGEDMVAKGLRLVDVETDVHEGIRYYVGNWVSGTGSNLFASPRTLAEFNVLRQGFTVKGLRLIDFERFDDSGVDKYIGVWSSGTGEEVLTEYLNEADFMAEGTLLTRKDLRLIDVETKIEKNDVVMYKGLFRSGTGGNLFTTPRALANFETTRDNMLASGMMLDDMEIIEINGALQYIGVWKSGAGAGIISPPMNNKDFITFGNNFTLEGFRLADLEILYMPRGPNSAGGRGVGTGTGISPVPSYIEFSAGARIVIDFSTMVNGKPRITLPDSMLSALPWSDNELIFPDAFCGLKVIKAAAFQWHDQQAQTFLDIPYNHVDNVRTDVDDAEKSYYGGIDLTGPIGACANSGEGWSFPFPLTSSGDNPLPNMKLIIELDGLSRVEFLNYAISQPEGLDLFEAYTDDTKEQIEILLNTFSDQCGLEEMVMEACSENPTSCPVSAAYVPSC